LGLLRYIIVTPQYHRIHHSLEKRHWNKNFADRLVLWDILFRTRYAGADEFPDTGIEGYPVREVGYYPWQVLASLAYHMIYPFLALARHIRVRLFGTQSLGGTAAVASEADHGSDMAFHGTTRPTVQAEVVKEVLAERPS
jgi:hypothetical protein